MQQEEYMLIFSLGPVQTFIAQARKTRDLWLGSLLVAKLMQAALAGIEENGTLVFPANTIVEGVPDIPNKYIAIFDDKEAARLAAAKSIKQIQQYWEDEICKPVWNTLLAKHGDHKTRDIWNRQTNFETLFEVYWVVVLDPTLDELREHGLHRDALYKAWLAKAEGALAARKRLRDFQFGDEPGEKSTISGEREVLRTANQDTRVFWRQIAANRRTENDLDQEGQERLDAIDTIKRFVMNVGAIKVEQAFPSTSSIATAPYIEQLLTQPIDQNILESWEKATQGPLRTKLKDAAGDIPYLKTVSQKAEGATKKWLLELDGDLYFSAMFARDRLKKDYATIPENELDDRVKRGNGALKNLLLATDDKNITRPTPYYAVLQMDGDNLGILLSGVENRTDHKKISEALSDFSREGKKSLDNAKSIVEKRYPGRLVYAGGDDALAFAPLARDFPLFAPDSNGVEQLETVLDLTDALQKTYCSKVKAVMSGEKKEERIQKVTVSTGIVIAHHYTSLSYVMRCARDAEASAKKKYGKNALVVTVLRRSGEQTSVGCHWLYPHIHQENGQPIPLFKRFYHLFKEDILSPKCIYTLLEEAPVLIGLEKDALISEVRRVLLRQLDDDAFIKRHLLLVAKEERQQEIKRYIQQEVDYLINLAEQMDLEHTNTALATELHSDKIRYGIVEVLGWLLVMLFFARKDQE